MTSDGTVKLWERSSVFEAGPIFRETDPASIKIQSPTVVFFPGLFTTTPRRQYVNEALGEVQSLLERHGVDPMPKIYGVTHASVTNIFNLVAYNSIPCLSYSRAARDMAEVLLMPLVAKDGKPLPIDEAARNLRNLTFVAYSAGTVFAQEIYNAALKKMRKIGYDRDTAKALLEEVALISMAAVSRPTREKNRFTTLYLAATNDVAVRLKDWIWRPLSKIFSRRSRDLVVRKISGTSLFISAAMGQKMWEWRHAKDGQAEKRVIAPLLPPPLKLQSNHEMPHYITCDDAHNGFSKIVLYGLVNAIRRTRKLEALHLIEPLGIHAPHETDSYRSRIAEGLKRGLLHA